MSLIKLAGYNEDLGNYPEAISLSTEASEILRAVLGPEHPDYAMSLNDLAVYNADLGNYTEAIRLSIEVIEIRRKVLGPEHPAYATSLLNLAGYNSDLGNYTEAIRLSTEATEILRNILGPEHPNYAISLNNLADCNSILGNYTEAIRLCTEAIENQRKILGPQHPDYAMSLGKLAFYYSCLGNYTEAIRLGTEAVEIQRKSFGPEHPIYSTTLFCLAFFNFILDNHSESFHLIVQSLQSSHDFILKNFSELSANQQESLWFRGTKSFAFNTFFPLMVFKYRTEDSISELYDMNALFAKGILLNLGIEKRRLILESGDPDLVARYDALISNRCIYNKQLEKPLEERAVNLDSLRSVMEQQEMELARDSKAYGDFSRNLRITWQDVQGELEDDDIAIEFLDFPVYGTDSTMYVALTLRKGYDSPRLIPLFEKGRLDSVPEGDYYLGTQLYDLVWRPLEGELGGVRDIYFTPSGELHRIGMEYVPSGTSELICDRYRLHRLSSTRQLAVVQDGTRGEKGVVYGGLDYDAVPVRDITESSSLGRSRGLRNVPRADVDSLSLRGSFFYLPATMEEADMIASGMKLHKVPYTRFTGKEGTEESFKQLDGTRPRILHIATHGFYLTEQEAEEKSFARPLLLSEGPTYREDKPMTRSGLLLSGCRIALNHQVVPDGVEDGILTAQEISELDLRGLDLVVLSACQTGLGDIVSGEGVFGLQRGFKNAGARTIVMSLWKVDDNATLDLMVSFYKHYLGGKTKEEAFRLAREELRRKSQPGKIRPDWAAFVMLDGE